MAADLVIPTVAKVVECIVEPLVIRPLRPIFCFKSIVDDFRSANSRLSEIQETVGHKVQQARNNAQVISNNVAKWLEDVNATRQDVHCLENQLEENYSSRCSNWTCHYRLSKQVLKITTILRRLCEDGDFRLVAHSAPLHQHIVGSSSSPDFMPSQSARSAFSQILEALKKDGVNMIGLYGMGGIGKTTLAKQVQKEVERIKMFDHTIMVTISQRPEVRSIQGIIADFLSLKLEQETEEGRSSKLNQRLKDEKILVILDDLWKQIDLATVGIMLRECKGCKILLTTRRKSVCDAMDCQTIIQLNLLSKDEAHNFFKKKACLSKELKLSVLAEQVVEECKGLPIALATVGAALRSKGEDEWREALDNLRNSRLVDIVGVDNDEINAYKCLRLSYDYLTHSAKAQEGQLILLLCALYPEDHKIGVEDVTRYAFAMDLFHRATSIEDMRRKVRVTVRFLKDSCLLLDTEEEQYVKMHDVVRDVILWIGGTEPREKNVLTVRDESDLKEFIKNNSFQNCRAMSFMANSLSVISKHDPLVCPNLETIIIFGGEHEVVELSDDFFQHMKLLRVLDLRSGLTLGRRCRFGMPESLQNSTYLHTLMLDYCECLNSFIIRELRNLEILSLKGCKIDCEEEVVSGLKKLRLLDLSDWNAEGTYPSNMIETFLKLEELHGYIIQKCKVGAELKLPSNLVALSMTIEDAMSLPMGFCLPSLQAYHIRVGKNWDWAYMSVPSIWRVMELEGIEEESAVINICDKLLPTVQQFYFKCCHDLSSLNAFSSHADGFLQRLQRLEVRDCKKMQWVFELQVDGNVGNNITSVVQLQFLKMLKLKLLPELEQVWKGPTSSLSLCSLTEMTIWRCSKLTSVFPSPSLAASLRQLEILRIEDCDDLEEIIASDDDDDFSCCCSFTNLRHLEVSHCGKLKTVFSIVKSTERAHHLHPQSSCCLPKLQRIYVLNNYQLEHIFGHQSHVECPSLQVLQSFNDSFLDNIERVEQQLQRRDHDFPKNTIICFSFLRRVELKDCNKLKQVFTTSLVASLHRLEVLVVQRCNELEQVVSKVGDGKEELAIGVCFENLKTLEVRECGKLKTIFPFFIALPRLQRLLLESNSELEHVFGRPDSHCTWKYPFFGYLCVVGCPKMCTQFSAACIHNLSTAKAVKEIRLAHIRGVEELIQIHDNNEDPGLLTSPLQTLSVRTMEELKCIWFGPTQNICLADLCEIEVIGCNSLKHIFAMPIARSLPKLKKLIVRRCNELEQVIIVEDGKERETDAKVGLILEVGFQNLQVLHVSSCEKLKTVFSAFLPLPKLDSLRLESNAQLESLFGKSECDYTSHLTYLKGLSVTCCPKLCKQFVAMVTSQLRARTTQKLLKIINLSNIGGVEELVQFQRQEELQFLKLEDVGDLKRIWSEPAQKVSFSNLVALRVIGCNRLKQLFTTTMATTLCNLQLLSVERCHELEQVVQEEEDELLRVQQLELSRLVVLRLIDLPKLVRFSPTSCNLLLPLLAGKNLKVEGCPKPITGFFSERSHKQGNEVKYLYEFDDDKDEDDDFGHSFYTDEKSWNKLFGARLWW